MKSTSETQRCYWQLNPQGFNYHQRKSVQLIGATSKKAWETRCRTTHPNTRAALEKFWNKKREYGDDMPSVALSPLFNDAQLDSSGNPLTGGKLFTYAAGSSTKLTTYQDFKLSKKCL